MTEILENSRNDDDFGLVLVVGWPPNPATLQQPYNALVKAMRSCFDEKDQEKSAYFYPLSSLHVTVATLHAFTLETQDAKRRAVLEREWRSLVVAASKRLEWPKQPLKLKVESCQIGSRAGILLWREVTGGLERMRRCIREETMARRDQLENAAISVDSLRIPGIIHSSVLRFPFPVTTDGNVVQERFQRLVLPRLDEMFSKTTVEARHSSTRLRTNALFAPSI